MTLEGTILFVCTGNLCRSPMAEGILKAMLRSDAKHGRYHVRSAGTWTEDGLGASALAVQAMRGMGIDITTHRSHRLVAEDVSGASLIIVMTRGHKEALLAEVPQAGRKIILLSELGGGTYDIDDPYGSDSLQLYRECASRIDGLLRQGYDRILELVAVGAEGD
jgi:protein-tyrosine-phosphatase